ncbi:site-specific recombinase XerD [Rhizobium sp. PP-WC-2G-219]|nr:site-specific recombinase XerD [Rhizobium sp. PP-WC-2G-219]
MRVTSTGSRLFVAQRRIGGKPIRVSIGRFPEMSVLRAREEARAILNTMGQGVDPRKVQAAPAKSELSFADATDKWLNEHVRLKLKDLTVRDYEKISDELKTRFIDRTLASISKDDARKLHAEKSATARRANYYLAVLSAICNYSDNLFVTKGVKRFRENRHERIMTTDEMERAFGALHQVEADKTVSVFACAAIRFAILTGARPAEIKAIEWKHLDHERKRVVLEDSKANRQRIIYTNEAAWTVLNSVPHFGKYVFAGEKKNTAYSRLTNAWTKVRQVAKLPDVRLYDCRHSFASQAAMAGHNLPMIGALLGHTVAATTQRYVHLVGDPASKASEDVGKRMAAAMAQASAAKGATPMKSRKRSG